MAASHFLGTREIEKVSYSEGPITNSKSKGLFETGLWGDQGDQDHLGPAKINEEMRIQSVIFSHDDSIRKIYGSSRFPSSRQKVSQKPFRGRYIQPRPISSPPFRDLAWDAILKAAAPCQGQRKISSPLLVRIGPQHLRQKLRLANPGRLLLFLVDISGSMGNKYMTIAKKAALLLLNRAYVKRDHIGVLAFRNRMAALLVPPTNQAEKVHQVMADLLCGGLTPLSAGLELARHTLWKARNSNPGLESILILISDGKANVGAGAGYDSMQAEIMARARTLRRHPQLRILFLDTTEEGKVDYPAQWLSKLLSAERYVLSGLLLSGFDPAVEIAYALEI